MGASRHFTAVRVAGSLRRRDTDAHGRILQATMRVLRRRGYASFSIEAVAGAAGVSKATIYRWWSGKAELVAEAVATRLRRVQVPNTGRTRADLVEVVRQMIAIYTGTAGGGAVVRVAADLTRDRRLLHAFRKRFLRPRRAAIKAVFARGKAGGRIPRGLDVDLVLDVWAGTLFFRHLVSGAPIGPRTADQLVDLVIPFDRRPAPRAPR